MTEWQGFSGPSYPKKNYDFELINEQGIKIDSSILNMNSENDWIFKAEYLDHSLIKNSISYEMSRRMGNYAPNIRPCELFLDGVYIGYYSLTEKIKRDNNRVDISKLDSNDISGLNLTGGYIIEMNINGDPADWTSAYSPSNSATACCNVEFKHVYPKSEDILSVQHDYIKNYVDTFENVLAGFNFADSAFGYEKYIDVNTFIDFLIVNEFSVNYDSYGRSTFMYKDKGEKLCIGPAWDYDRAMDYVNISTAEGWVWETTHPYWPFPFHWQRLFEDESYRKKLACRWQMLRQDILSNNSVMTYIDSLSQVLTESANRNFVVWNDLGGDTYSNQIVYLKDYLTTRLQWIDNELSLENVNVPEFYIPSDTIFCLGEIYDASFNGTSYNYQWVNFSDSSEIQFNSSGLYNLKVTDNYGCYTQKIMNVILSDPNSSFDYVFNGSISGWDFVPQDLNVNTYFWDFGDGNNSFEQICNHSYLIDGTYIVSLTVMDSNSCFKTTSQPLMNYASLMDLNISKFRLFPNPFKDDITLILEEDLSTEVKLTITDEIGQEIKSFKTSSNFQTISLANFRQGFYILQVEYNGKKITQKIIKS
jgi:hypothetical protein